MQALRRAHPGTEDNAKPLSQTYTPDSIIPSFIHTSLEYGDVGQTSYLHITKLSHALTTESQQSKLEMWFRYLYICVQSEMRVQHNGS